MAPYEIQVPTDKYFHHVMDLPSFSGLHSRVDTIAKTGAHSVLELGVGNGLLAYYLKNILHINHTSFDFDETLHPDEVGDIRDLSRFKKNSFDVVVAFNILEHIPYEDSLKVLKEMKRVATSHVIICIPYPCASSQLIWKLQAIPFIRKTLSMTIKIPYFPIKVEFNDINKEHYWELGKRGYPKHKFKKFLKKHFSIEKEFQPLLNPLDYFFVLRTKR